MAGHTQSDEREKPTTQVTIPKGSHSNMKEKSKALWTSFLLFSYRQVKGERIQHLQTSSSTNAKGSSLDRTHRKGL